MEHETRYSTLVGVAVLPVISMAGVPDASIQRSHLNRSCDCLINETVSTGEPAFARA